MKRERRQAKEEEGENSPNAERFTTRIAWDSSSGMMSWGAARGTLVRSAVRPRGVSAGMCLGGGGGWIFMHGCVAGV